MKAPDVVASIMLDDNANARHRIDASKTLNDFAANPHEGAPAGDMFSIIINLGSDADGKPIVERYDKSIAINADDIDPNEPVADQASRRRLAGRNRSPKTNGNDDGGII